MIDNVIAIMGGRIDPDHRRQAINDLLDGLLEMNAEYEALRSENDLARQLLQCAVVYLADRDAADDMAVQRLIKRIAELGGAR
jgi:hypothetical protein